MSYDAMSGVRFDFDGSLALARDLWRMAESLVAHRSALAGAGEVALAQWLGLYGEEFAGRLGDQDVSIVTLAEGLQQEAVAWGIGWAAAMNEANRRRRAAAVEAEQRNRSLLEKVGDIFVGDDSEAQITRVVEVGPPQPPGFAATGGLQTF